MEVAAVLETYKQLIVNQYEAVLSALNFCVDRCPDDLWTAPVGGSAFCQAVFHALFYADFYLEPGEESLRQQPFHHANPDFFRDYEELEDRQPVQLYTRAEIKRYLQHCREKAAATLAAESAAILSGPAGFARRSFTRAELHIYNIRHLQDHGSQLGMYLGAQAGFEMPWFGSGWREVA
jgi:hypothetical protein